MPPSNATLHSQLPSNRKTQQHRADVTQAWTHLPATPSSNSIGLQSTLWRKTVWQQAPAKMPAARKKRGEEREKGYNTAWKFIDTETKNNEKKLCKKYVLHSVTASYEQGKWGKFIRIHKKTRCHNNHLSNNQPM